MSTAAPDPAPDQIYADPRLAACYDTFDGERDDLDHYEALIDELGARTIVDVGCGTGSLAVRLAARGLTVTGVDPAAASLDVARSKPHAEAVTWIHGTAPDLPPLGADLAVMTGNVAQVFLTDESWLRTLRGIRAALRPGGWFVAESRRPERRAWEEWQADTDPQVHEVPGVGHVRSRARLVEVALPLVTFTDDFRFEDGATRSSTSTLRFRTEVELRASLAEAGLEVRDIREAPDRPGREYVLLARAV
ncbi:class I SAM-dependent methyltransferase [Brachybacterium sp. NBEC-018]|uniref:class I SAM-dependent methyltransferase n=1 Tax=Brachybacterium sp. NBEC-018 TaxID=2996004 RepID=UPI002175671C|nr:class I SAM-dependent methyltransferase [Brachybacterium sp. NBEC-018]UVY85119.1 class I SAM-dependent methyltransferase [Brachybacterium sp. NBEC-018]